MGRQAYLNRLALGRSPYEAPERPEGSTARTTYRTDSGTHADEYVQHYDDRGHPVNPESKSFGRELRRAKNDILSTMGIVVSEDAKASGPSEQQKVDMIAAENDYGLVMATLDQVSVFLGSWWTSSLAGRIQTFRSYTHEPLMNILRRERASVGIVGFYFAGIPSWAISTCLSICRHHPLERFISSLQNRFPGDDIWSKMVRSSFTLLHSATRGTLLIMAIQTYMYSLLQSLHLVHPYALPGLHFLIPFGEFAPMQFPSLPTDISPTSLASFALHLVKTPSFLVYLYVYLRPVIEIRLYRLIRRRLPKPTLADELSIKVAFDNDLIDWMVPTLGRRSEEENRRNSLTLLEDVMYEISFLKDWALSWVGFKSQRTIRALEQAADARHRQLSESLPPNIEQLRNELQATAHRAEELTPPQHQLPELAAIRTSSPQTPAPVHSPDSGVDFGGSRVLPHEEDRMSHSPAEMSAEDFTGMPLDRTRAAAPTAGQPSTSANVSETRPDGGNNTDNRRHSRSNTLFSRPSSPETSSPTSPRVRASLIHQNSDVITMQLELLGSRNLQNHGQLNPRTGNQIEQLTSEGEPADRRSISEFLDTLLSNQGQNLSTIVNSDTIDSDGLSNLTPGLSPTPGDIPPTPAVEVEDQPQIASADPPTGNLHLGESLLVSSNILPDSVEEPIHDDTQEPPPDIVQTLETDFDSELMHGISDTAVREAPMTTTTGSASAAHRVTILSSHPVDSLASHLASMITTVLFLPLESLYLRSLASSYLSSTGAPAIQLANVRGLGVWGGGGPRTDKLTYLGKMTLMLGIQAAVNASVWGIISGSAIKIGRKFCGWGTL
ncbi:hypothetical protein P168DRAFT_329117 [Aspergillus campestris IBT 28561]|uniref:Uncharacterized protein n=1 Tax=Aspergillus campestris (strain IBT 28561) TaxID=1392248 RepID=A0A2I1CWZ5_ASPC2|nr:uncharacterized protein P168DRAFT_329117 [Aspergillus campestris IBT 28561]PKY02147.1 hypothetical protein P168DRAFT_329117 [Aspergillus campestris IBT 28561]